MGIGKTCNPLLIDVASQMLPWRQAVRNPSRNGRLPLWNRFLLGGEPLLAVAQPAVSTPERGSGSSCRCRRRGRFDMTLRISSRARLRVPLLRGTGASEVAALLGGLAWAFSDFLMFFVGYPVTPSIAPFPLLLLALGRLSRGGGLAAAAMTAGAVLMAIAGHPETLLFAVVGAGVAFLFWLAWAAAAGGSPVLRSLGAGVLAFGLAAVALLPLRRGASPDAPARAPVARLAQADRSETPIERLRRLLSNVVPFAYGRLGESEVVPRYALPVGYTGSVLFPLIAAGLRRPRPPRVAWIVFGRAGPGALGPGRGGDDLVAEAAGVRHRRAEYFVFLAIFGAVALAVEALDRLARARALPPSWRRRWPPRGRSSFGRPRGRRCCEVMGMRPEYLRLRVLRRGRSASARGGARRWVSRKRRGRGLGAGARLLLLFAGSAPSRKTAVYPTIPERAFYPPLGSWIRFRGASRPLSLGSGWTDPNMSALYGLEDVADTRRCCSHRSPRRTRCGASRAELLQPDREDPACTSSS